MRVGTVLAGLFALIMCLVVLSWVTGINQRGVTESSAGADESRPASAVHNSNPFDGEHPTPPPKLEIGETNFDFGRMALGDEMTHTFVVRNSGESELKLAVGPSTCKCTVGTLTQDTVPPDGSVEVNLEWHPRGSDPAFVQQATIFTNDPQQPELKLEVQGLVANRLKVFPSEIWMLTAVLETEETPFEFVIVSQVLDSFEITSVKPSNDLIHVDVTPLAKEELEELESAQCGYRLHGRLGVGFPVGDIREHLIVSTDVTDFEEMRLSIMTSRIGPYSVIGPGWNAAARLLNMGRFEAREGKPVKLGFFVQEEDDRFQFTDAHVEPPVLDVSWEPDPGFEAPTRHRIWIKVVAPEGMTPARWDRSDPIEVVMSTNDPGVPEWKFFVALQAN